LVHCGYISCIRLWSESPAVLKKHVTPMARTVIVLWMAACCSLSFGACFVATRAGNIRSGPGLDDKVAGTLQTGFAYPIMCLGNTHPEWFCIKDEPVFDHGVQETGTALSHILSFERLSEMMSQIHRRFSRAVEQIHERFNTLSQRVYGAYHDHLTGIDPNELPENLQVIFEAVKERLEAPSARNGIGNDEAGHLARDIKYLAKALESRKTGLD